MYFRLSYPSPLQRKRLLLAVLKPRDAARGANRKVGT